MKDQQKNPAERKSPQEHGNATITLQLTHDPKKNAKIRLQCMARAARRPPLGEGYEQAGAATVEQEMGQEQQPRQTKKISAEHKSPQEHGIANFKIPTLKRASNQPGDIYAASHMDWNEDATGIIYIRGRHSPPPRSDLTTHTMLPTLQMRNDPTKTAPHQARPAQYHSLGDGHERPQPAPKLLQGTVSKYGQKVPQQISIQNLQPVESTEPERDAESHLIICTDLPPRTASPVSRTPLTQPLDQDSDVPQYFSNEKYQQIERTRVRVQHHPFGDAHGHIDASIALGREGSHVAQCMTAQRPHTQTMLPTIYREATSPHQTGICTPKKASLNNLCTENLSPCDLTQRGVALPTNPRENMAV